MLILNVDDHDHIRYSRSRILRRAGYEVIEAADAAEALQQIKTRHPGVVLLDVHLPDLIGVEVARIIKSDASTALIQVVQISGTAISEPVQAAALQAGADYYLTDPAAPEVLIGTITAAARHWTTLQELKTVKEALQRSNEDLERFAFTVSHDLKEPLRMISSYTELLVRRNKGSATPDSEQFAQFIQTGVERLGSLIDGLLQYSRFTHHEEPQEVDSAAVLDRVVENLALAVSDANARVTSDPLPHVYFHQDRLIQIFQNLVQNAIKYRGQQTPEIHVCARKQGREWIFAVRDNGIGFDQSHAKDVFGPFTRLHTREEYEGSGIGLAICKRLIEQGGGRIWAESEVGVGSTFYFTIPATGCGTGFALPNAPASPTRA